MTRHISAPLPPNPASAALVKALRNGLPTGWCVWSSKSGHVACGYGDLPDLHMRWTGAGWAFDGAEWAAEDVVGVRARVLGVVGRRQIQKSANNQEKR
jgi:hypothetical protein